MNVPFNMPDIRKEPTTTNSVIFSVTFQSFKKNPIKHPTIATTDPIKNDNPNYFHPSKNSHTHFLVSYSYSQI